MEMPKNANEGAAEFYIFFRKPVPAVPGYQAGSYRAARCQQVARNPGSNSTAYPSAAVSVLASQARLDWPARFAGRLLLPFRASSSGLPLVG